MKNVRMLATVVVFATGICVWSWAQDCASDNTFKKATGNLYCEAPHGGSGCHANGSLTIALEPGTTIDRSYNQGSLRCCGGDENANGQLIPIPAGVCMKFDGGSDGEWGVFNIRLVADANNVDDQGRIKAWTVIGDVYCGPSAAVGKGGCNGKAFAWIKMKKLAGGQTVPSLF